MKQSDRIIVQKMISYCGDINQLMIRFHRDYEIYCNDISFQYACNMCIIQIGELVSRASNDMIDNNPQIPWRAIKGMRNLHAHDYENVDLGKQAGILGNLIAVDESVRCRSLYRKL